MIAIGFRPGAVSTHAVPGKVGLTARTGLTDRYIWLLCFVLIGYACFGRGFAYIGLSPLYIGEVTLALGLVMMARTGCRLVTLFNLATVLLAVLICWAAIRAASDVGRYGIDALRDSVIILYGLFAYIVIALLIERPQRLAKLIDAYGKFCWFYAPASIFLLNANIIAGSAIPMWPGTDISFVSLRWGEAATHLSGTAVFVLLGFRRISLAWTTVLVVALAVLAPNRGGMLACVVSIGLAAWLGGKLRRLMPALTVGAVLFVVALAAGVEIEAGGQGRVIGPQQLVDNVQSIVGNSDESNLDGTKLWRLRWWHAIEDYTVFGDYFWLGKGFGVNLAVDDGFTLGPSNGPPLRSPHNGHLTILARLGVPGLVLWICTCGAWFAMLFRNMVTARRSGDIQFANLFLWIGCYALAMLIDAAFDVALEGPMIGIWFWCLFGLGVASTMIYRAAAGSRTSAANGAVANTDAGPFSQSLTSQTLVSRRLAAR